MADLSFSQMMLELVKDEVGKMAHDEFEQMKTEMAACTPAAATQPHSTQNNTEESKL